MADRNHATSQTEPGRTPDAGHAKGTDVDQFAREAQRRSASLPVELLEFMRVNKKWWLTPILLALLLVTVMIVLASTGAAPFIYTLF